MSCVGWATQSIQEHCRLVPAEVHGATLRALLTEPPQEVRDDRALEDTEEILDPEAEAYANVGASTSLPDLAVGAVANVGAPVSPPVLDVVVAANVGTTTSVAQTTTRTEFRQDSDIGVGWAIGGDSAPVREFPPPPSPTRVSVPIEEYHNMARHDSYPSTRAADPSLVAKHSTQAKTEIKYRKL